MVYLGVAVSVVGLGSADAAWAARAADPVEHEAVLAAAGVSGQACWEVRVAESDATWASLRRAIGTCAPGLLAAGVPGRSDGIFYQRDAGWVEHVWRVESVPKGNGRCAYQGIPDGVGEEFRVCWPAPRGPRVIRNGAAVTRPARLDGIGREAIPVRWVRWRPDVAVGRGVYRRQGRVRWTVKLTRPRRCEAGTVLYTRISFSADRRAQRGMLPPAWRSARLPRCGEESDWEATIPWIDHARQG